ATNRPMEQMLGLNGQIQLLPDAQADVSIRISGSVTAIDVNLGDIVKAGQRLATVQSRLVGNPPPSVAVTAPIAGLIDARNINLGQAVEPNTVLFHISNRDKLLVIAQVYEEDLGKVKVGQEVTIHALSYPKRTFPGQVTLIEPNLDPLTRTANVRITLDNKEGLLKTGMFVRANVILARNEAALA
ncbi:efflux RND transporter periplasmic adaptor subunit, partial [Legionella pneumophila]